jgi:hypothetical protein
VARRRAACLTKFRPQNEAPKFDTFGERAGEGAWLGGELHA